MAIKKPAEEQRGWWLQVLAVRALGVGLAITPSLVIVVGGDAEPCSRSSSRLEPQQMTP
jgi:hypothetical protein